MPSIVKNENAKSYPYTQYVIPFKFDQKKFLDIKKAFINDQYSDKESGLRNELFPHINQLIEQSNQNVNICTLLEKNHKKNNEIKMYFKNPIFEKDDKGKKTNILKYKHNIPIDNTRVYLFKTGVGFFCIEVSSEHENIDLFIERNNLIKSISHKNNCDEVIIEETKVESIPYEDSMLASVDDVDKIEIEDARNKSIKINIKRTINDVTFNEDAIKREKENIKLVKIQGKDVLLYNKIKKTDLKFSEFLYNEFEKIEGITYFNYFNYGKKDKVNRKMATKAHCFNSVLFENIEDEVGAKEGLINSIMMLGRGYKSSYKQDYNSQGASTFETFSNSIWSLAREGVANFVWLTGDEKGDEFFRGTYLDRLDNYFYLYILAIHQYYSLIKISEEISNLPSAIDDYISKENDENYKALQHIFDSVNFIYLKCIYHEVTHITHQAHFYSKLYEVLGIDLLVNEINYEVDRLTSIVTMKRQEETSLSNKIAEERRVEQQEANRQLEKLAEKRRLEQQDAENIAEKLAEKRMRIFTVIGAMFLLINMFGTISNILSDLNIYEVVTEYSFFSTMSPEMTLSILSVVAILGAVLISAIVYLIWLNIGKSKESA